MSTQPLLDTLLAGMSGQVDFDIRRCLRSRFNQNGCHRCLDVCRTKGLVLEGRHIVFTGAECTGCMQCVAVCPNDAFVQTIDCSRIIEGMAGVDDVVLSCAKEKLYRNQVTIPCVGLFSEMFLAVMNTVVRGHGFIDISRCSGCLNHHCLESLHNNMQNLASSLQGAGDVKLRCLDDPKHELLASVRAKRRSFLHLMGKTFTRVGRKTLIAQPFPSEGMSRLTSKGPVLYNRILSSGIEAAAEERKNGREELSAYFFTVSATDQCDCCPSCTGMCPTGALKRNKDKGNARLMFTSGHCSGCGLCVGFCQKSALILQTGYSEDPQIPVVIAEKNTGQDTGIAFPYVN